jgi:molecular chaperone GrpE
MKNSAEANKEIKKEKVQQTNKPENKKKEDKELHEALEQNKKLANEIKATNERVIRLSAEIQNIGKRHSDEIQSMAKYEGIDLIKKLLPIVDNFERSIAMDKTVDEKYLAGYKMIYTNMLEILTNTGVKEIECNDKPFDPNTMEAILTEHVEGVDKGYVLMVLQKGYIYKDKLLRPAMVKVSE